MSRARVSTSRGFVLPSLQPKGPRGFPLCRWCHRECPSAKHTFCSATCVHEHRLRSDPVYLRRCVLERDRGVCAVCGLDTVAAWEGIAAMPLSQRRARAESLGFPWHRVQAGSLWDADHVVPVAEGGGECDLGNLQTLCVGCHAEKTARQLGKARDRGPGA